MEGPQGRFLQGVPRMCASLLLPVRYLDWVMAAHSGREGPRRKEQGV